MALVLDLSAKHSHLTPAPPPRGTPPRGTTPPTPPRGSVRWGTLPSTPPRGTTPTHPPRGTSQGTPLCPPPWPTALAHCPAHRPAHCALPPRTTCPLHSDSSTPHSDASTHHVSPLRHAGDKAGRNRTYAARPTSSRSFSPRARLLRNRTYAARPGARPHRTAPRRTTRCRTRRRCGLHAAHTARRAACRLDELGELGGVPCNSTVRGDSAVKLCTKECKPSKVQGQCKTCHCSSCSWCKK